MSADLPDMRHDTSNAMARVLVTYMACPRAVFSRIKEDFDTPPALRTIERYRAEYLADRERPRELTAFKPHDGYYPNDAYDAAHSASVRFLAALAAERMGT